MDQEKDFTVYLTKWDGEFFYIKENKTGKKVGMFFGSARRHALELLKKGKAGVDRFAYEWDVYNEPNPIPMFVTHYEIREVGGDFKVIAHLTERGIMRKTFDDYFRRKEEEKMEEKEELTPFGPFRF